MADEPEIIKLMANAMNADMLKHEYGIYITSMATAALAALLAAGYRIEPDPGYLLQRGEGVKLHD